MARIRSLALFFLFIPAILFAGEQSSKINSVPLTAKEKAWIHKHPVVRYGGEKDWASFDFVDQEGKHTGLSSDLLQLIGKYSGLSFQVEVANWDELLAAIKAQKIDVLPTIYYTEERQKYLQFTNPYQLALAYFFIHETVQAKTLDDLNGKTIAITKGYAQIDEVKQRFPKLRILETDNLMASVQAVLERKADVLLETYAVMNYLLKQKILSSLKGRMSANTAEPGLGWLSASV